MKRPSCLVLCLLLILGCNADTESVATQNATPVTGIAVAWTPTPKHAAAASPAPTRTSPQPASPTPTETPALSPAATSTPSLAPTAELPGDEQVLANLVAFARLYGYVRYFHPSDEAAGLNWERVAINGVEGIRDAVDPADLARKLLAFFQPCAPTLRVFPVAERPEVPAELVLPEAATGLQVVMWRHYGVEGEYHGSIYHSDRIYAPVAGGEIPDGLHDPRDPFYAELGSDVAALVPLALFADGAGTLPQVQVTRQNQPDRRGRSGTTDQRLAGVIMAWNVFQHFYPYFAVVDTDWPQVLEDSLVGALYAADETAYQHVLRRLLAQLHDGHAFLTVDRAPVLYAPDVRLVWVEDNVVVLHAGGNAAHSLAAGDVILKIDGQPTAQALAGLEELTSGATPQWKRVRAFPELLAGSQRSTLLLEVETTPGEARLVSLQRNVKATTVSLPGPRPAVISELEPGILYVDLTRARDEDLQAAMPQLEAARGIIFDLRGYPQLSKESIGHLIDAPVSSPPMYVPIVTYPDQQTVAFDFLFWEIEPETPRFQAKVAFLTDGRALSYAETYLGIVEHYQLAEIVGQPTGGTNGNRDWFRIPGGYTCSWTPMKVLKHDGSPLHGVGIQPTILVSRTVQGLREGRDEQLERAIEAVK